MIKMSRGDIQQMYVGCILLASNKPVYVESVSVSGKILNTFNLLKQKTEQIEFNSDKLKAPPRIGFVNVDGVAVSLERRTVRRFKLGVYSENLKFSPIPDEEERFKVADIIKNLSRLKSREIALSLTNQYPTYVEAFQQVIDGASSVAFDKQFVIRSTGQLWYKNLKIGVGKRDGMIIPPQFQHYAKLMGAVNEKVIQISAG